VLVVPIKRLSEAKSRLRGAVPGVPHERLALALAQDTVAAAVQCADVFVITSDPLAGPALAQLGARVAPDRPDAGLNAALAYGAEVAARPGRRVGALTADLPSLRAGDLAGALDAAGRRRGFVPDAAGTGTTLLVAGPGERLDPGFGPGSARAHERAGARALPGAATLRRDVDTAADLAAAVALGLGRHTAALLPPGYGAGMQGTVATYDAETRSGTLLLDDGSEIAFPAAAFEASGLRLLRQGQRVRIETEASGQVTRVTLPTF
jgi:2-phospho-L-lactate guanylyltransferase